MYRAHYERRIIRRINSSFRRNYHRRRNAESLWKKRHGIANNFDVDMAGFRQITNSNNSLWWRIAWTVITLTTLLGCCYQCGERLQRYFSDPSEINMYYIVNQTLTFPSMTVCPSFNGYTPQVNPFLFKKHVDNSSTFFITPITLLEKKNLSIIDLWELATIDRDLTIFRTHSSKRNKDSEEKQIIDSYTTEGKCTTFIGWKNVSLHGVQTFQYAEWKRAIQDMTLIRIQFHSEQDTVLVKYLVHIQGLLYAYESKYFIMQITELIYRNTWKNPCSDDVVAVNNCVVSCIEKYIHSRVTNSCRLPFMQDSDVIMPCTSAEEFSKMTTATKVVIDGFQIHHCNCPKKCREIVYSVNYIDDLFKFTKSRFMHFGMLLGESRISVIEEVASYSGYALFSDLGGSIGLYLGINALQTIEVLAAFATRLSKFRNQG